MSGEARERGHRQVGDFLPMVPELEDMQALGPKAVRGPREQHEQPLQEAFLLFHTRWGEFSSWTLGEVCQGVAKDSRDSSFVPKLDG